MKRKRSTKIFQESSNLPFAVPGNAKLKLPILYYAREIDTFFHKMTEKLYSTSQVVSGLHATVLWAKVV